jgi:hypothetical protein
LTFDLDLSLSLALELHPVELDSEYVIVTVISLNLALALTLARQHSKHHTAELDFATWTVIVSTWDLGSEKVHEHFGPPPVVSDSEPGTATVTIFDLVSEKEQKPPVVSDSQPATATVTTLNLASEMVPGQFVLSPAVPDSEAANTTLTRLNLVWRLTLALEHSEPHPVEQGSEDVIEHIRCQS